MNLPGISKICYIDATTLNHQIGSKAIARLKISITSGLNEIKFLGEARCSIEEKIENNGTVEEVELRFATTERIDTSKHIAFVVQDVNGEYYLIGTKERPYPGIKQEKESDTPSGSSAIWNVEVQNKGMKALIPCTLI